MIAPADWTIPTAVHFGPGRITMLGELAAQAGLRRPLIVTDAAMAANPDVARALAEISGATLGRDDGTPTEAEVAVSISRLEAGAHDSLIAIGGGSVIDLAKLVSSARGGLPVIAVPTTAGSGAEVARTAVVAAADGERRVVATGRLSVAVILDPVLTLGLPPGLTAGSGMDAFVHCLEAYASPAYHPLAEGVAVEGIRLVKDYLPRACLDGSDLEARGQMLVAAMLGGTAQAEGGGAIHALAHPIEARHGTHHGLTVAVLLPYVLDFNQDVLAPKIERLAAWLELQDGFSGFIDFVLRLRRTLGIPHTLDRLGVDAGRIGVMAAQAAADPAIADHPRALGEADVAELYERAFEGRVG